MVSKSNHFRESGVSHELIEEINKQTEQEDRSSLDGITEENDI